MQMKGSKTSSCFPTQVTVPYPKHHYAVSAFRAITASDTAGDFVQVTTPHVHFNLPQQNLLLKHI